ncbi:relaxase/mobilization nuclease domain-containing protein [Burkholderia sp. 9779_493]|uniref:relaxase/mobilization nuclease domain-containing protein n=1 Tax=Burkholderia sp. 9779_493 TaxID=2751184 RepID=UPI0018C3AD4D|nr:relaxase/mobilization nuclease domain-containing protein [Burkholderia sp. 9779_493]MBG0863713.1 relaxase/mobilization nuclease domain-containing protein [Burkholderia sp. 9779_493]
MIIKIIDNSPKKGKNGTATGAVNYVLSSHDHKKNERDFEPVVLDGDPQLTKDIDLLCSKFEHKCISGVISFAPDEKLTHEQKLQLIKEFKNTFLGNMKDRVNCLFVEHKEHDGEHIHFIINKIDLETGLAYNPFNPGDTTKELKECFVKIQNAKHGFNQVVADPYKLKLSNGEKKAKLYSEYKTKFSNLYTKENIHKACVDLIKNGVVKNKEELVKFLQEDMGYKLYNNQSNIVILKDNTKIVLKGAIYQNNNNSYADIRKGFVDWKQGKANEVDITKQIEKLNRLVKVRDDFNEGRYTAKQHKEVKFKNVSNKQAETSSRTVSPGRTTQPPTQQPKAGSSPVSGGSSEPMQAKTSNGQGFTGANEGRSADTTAFRAIGAGGSLGGAMAVAKAKSKLANAKTIEERINAEYELAIAQAEYEKQLLEQEENRKIEINGLKI